jgi:hypothetical protein
MTKLEAEIALCGLFEAELLARLILKNWEHPRESDDDFVQYLVESAAEVLTRSHSGEQFFEDVRPEDMNFVAAIWFAEASQVTDTSEPDFEARREWLAKVQRALPSCFCNPEELP